MPAAGGVYMGTDAVWQFLKIFKVELLYDPPTVANIS